MSRLPGRKYNITPNILFIVQAGSNVGMGHVTRSLVLAQELSRIALAKIFFWINREPISIARIKNFGFSVLGEGLDSIRIFNSLMDHGVHAIVFDQPQEFYDISRKIRQRSENIYMAALDYFNFQNADLDLIINLKNHNPHHCRPIYKNVRYYEGIQYGIIRREFDQYIKKKKPIPATIKNVLVSFGGSDPKRNTLRVIEGLKGCRLPEVCFHFVIGTHYRHREIVRRELAALQVQIKIHEDPSDIERLMFLADLGICGAGTTIMEMAAVGTPVLVIAQNPEEVSFANEFQKRGAAKVLGLAEQVRSETIRQSINEVGVDRIGRARMSSAAKQMVDGRGRQRIARMILEGISSMQAARVRSQRCKRYYG